MITTDIIRKVMHDAIGEMFKDSELDVSRAFHDVEILASRYYWCPHLLNIIDLEIMMPDTVRSLIRYSGMWRKFSTEEAIAIDYYTNEVMSRFKKYDRILDVELVDVTMI